MQNYFRRFTFLTLSLFVLANFSFAQGNNFPAPREETLLNELKVLIWSKPDTGRVEIKLRIHSGSAFDPQDKEGVMALLTEILFPEEEIKSYFEEDLEGSLELITTHDYIQINTTAKSSEFLNVMETLSSAVSETQIDKETVAKVKPTHLKKIKKLEKDPNYVADQAIAERLYGNYPYGRPINGTIESIDKLDFADLLFAKQRFLSADNATLTISGDVKSNLAYRAARRFFGSWQKSLGKIPANFRIPEKPDTTALTVNVDEQNILIDRYSMESFSRRDKDYFATAIFMEILDKRFKQISEQKGLKRANVVYNPNYLRGHIVFAKELDPNNLPVIKLTVTRNDSDSSKETETTKSVSLENENTTEFLTNLFKEKITESEFSLAKSRVLDKLNKTSPADLWFDVHTYKLGSTKNEFKKANDVTLNDVQVVALELSKNKIVEISIESVEIENSTKETVKEDVEIPNQLEKEEDPNDPIK